MSVTVLLEGCLLALLAAGCTSSVETTPPIADAGPAACADDQQCGTPAQSCCASPTIEGGTYNRLNDPKWPATVSSFRLDAFEVTVGRLRAFVEAYPDSRPKAGAGAHPKLSWSGWRGEWDSELPASKAELRQQLRTMDVVINPPPDYPDFTPYIAWSDAPGAHEDAAANGTNWYVAFAFCAWDGGRLPTNAEWNYAAVGGSEQRAYPWGESAPDMSRAVLQLSPTDEFDGLARVGSKPAGAGRFGQLDLGGNRIEWTLDWHDPQASPTAAELPLPCQDCAEEDLSSDPHRVVRDASFAQGPDNQVAKYELVFASLSRNVAIGLRCARDLP